MVFASVVRRLALTSTGVSLGLLLDLLLLPVGILLPTVSG